MQETKTVLVVDDEVGIRTLFSEILADEGFQVYVAENGAKADELMKKRDPDVVLLDIWLPDTDGMSLLKSWAQQGIPPCPIIMISGHASIDMAVEATKVGAFTFLEKPVSMKNLISTVQSAVRVSARQKVMAKSYSRIAQSSPAAAEPAHGVAIDFSLPLRQAREQFEKAYFAYLLEKFKGNISKVAQHAQVDRTNLYRKLEALGIDKSGRFEEPKDTSGAA